MDRKKVVLWSIIAVLVLAILLVWFLVPGQDEQRYSDDPKDWIDENGEQKSVDVVEATAGAGVLDDYGQEQFKNDYADTVFDMVGSYKGEYFERHYPIVLKEGEKPEIRITANMTPGDGVLEGYIITRFEGDQAYLVIFMDSDFAQVSEGYSLIWGAKFQNTRQLNLKKVSEGIYMDTVKDDPGRFIQMEAGPTQVIGGAVVGDMTRREWEDDEFEGKTFIMQK